MISNRSTMKKIMLLGALAIAVRLAVFIYVSYHQPEVILHPDSRSYMDMAKGYLQHGVLAHPEYPERPEAYRMPLYPLFLASVLALSGGNPLGVVLFQILFDGILVAVVFLLGERLWKGSGLLAGVFAACNLGLITYSHYVLTENLFLLFFGILLLDLLHFLDRGTWSKTLVVGVLMGVLTLIRPVSLYLPFLLFPFLLLVMTFKHRVHWGKAAAHVASMVAAFLLVLSPWVIRNHNAYGHYFLTAQTGEHLAQYVVPFVWQYSRGIPFIEGMKRMNTEMQKRADEAGVDLTTGNPYEASRLESDLAKEYLVAEPVGALVKAWIYGMVKNLFAPAAVDFSNLLGVDRPHYFATAGTTMLERAKNFIGSCGTLGAIFLLSMAAIALFRLLQLGGLYFMVKAGRRWEACLFSLIIAYFLLASGPVGYAKYRLPLEPILAVLAAISMGWIHEKMKQKRAGA